jgi:transcriptional regulator with XRE-family HTH domain
MHETHPASSEAAPFPQRLRALREEWTRRHGRRLTRERLAAALGVAPCTILRWESGSQEPYDCHIEALREFFGVSRQELGLTLPELVPTDAIHDVVAVSPQRSDGSDSYEPERAEFGMKAEETVIATAARQSSRHALLAGSASLMPTTLEQLHADVQRLARSYPQTAPPSLVGEMVRVRNMAYLMLERTRRPSQVKDLYLIAGQVCGLLALNSLDLGCPDAAADHARAAWSYAEIIEHDGLRAWARGTQAVVAFWSGRAREAVDLATSGQLYARSGPAMVRLRSVEARAWALVGDAGETRRAVTASQRALDDDRTDEFHTPGGGEFAFSPARQAFCAVASYVEIGDAAPAARQAETAIKLYSAAPVDGRWYRAEFGARVDLATARLMQRELDGTQEALSTVLSLPQGWRTARITRRLRLLDQRLADEPCRSASTARDLRERIAHFSAASIVCTPSG